MATDIFTILPDDFPAIKNGDAHRFECTRCGECCFDQLVLLEPQDMLGLRRHTGLSASEIFAQTIVSFERMQERWRAVLSTLPFGRGRRCRFVAPEMDGDRARRFGCELHAGGDKPLVCRLSPIAVTSDGFRLVAPIADCPGMNVGPERALDLASEADALTLSRFFHEEIEPRFGHDQALLQRAYVFEATTLSGLARYLRGLI